MCALVSAHTDRQMDRGNSHDVPQWQTAVNQCQVSNMLARHILEMNALEYHSDLSQVLMLDDLSPFIRGNII